MQQPQQSGFSNFGQRGRGNRGRRQRGRQGRGGGRGAQGGRGNHHGQPQYFMNNGYGAHQGHNPDQQQQSNGPTRRNISNYCWSHGACSHTGWQCFAPHVGHVPHETFQNRCGGCSDYCE